MTGRLGHAALALGLAQLIGCAQGYDGPLDDEPPLAGGFAAGIGSTGAGRGGAPSQAGTTPAGRSGGAGTLYTGEPCERGETEECMCGGGQGTGIRTCRKDDLSPTMGTFSPCEACVPGEEDPAGMGGGGSGSGRSGSGAAGRGGAGGSSSGAAGTGSSSAGRSGSSGSAGRSSGSSGSSGGSNDPAWCVFVPVPLPGVCD